MSEATAQHANLAEQATPKKPRGRPKAPDSEEKRKQYMKEYNHAHRSDINEAKTKYINKCIACYQLLKELQADQKNAALLRSNAEVWGQIETIFNGEK
jgi:hypothetical protein